MDVGLPDTGGLNVPLFYSNRGDSKLAAKP
jgi:hypothetical protein